MSLDVQVALIAGILILLTSRLLNYVVAIYLMVIGVHRSEIGVRSVTHFW